MTLKFIPDGSYIEIVDVEANTLIGEIYWCQEYEWWEVEWSRGVPTEEHERLVSAYIGKLNTP